MELPNDMLREIFERCDCKTKFNFAMTTKEIYIDNKNIFVDCEDNLFIKKMKKLLIDYENKCLTFHSRLRRSHQIVRTMIQFKHVLDRSKFSKLKTMLRYKLEQFGEEGMSSRKVKYYRKIFNF